MRRGSGVGGEARWGLVQGVRRGWEGGHTRDSRWPDAGLEKLETRRGCFKDCRCQFISESFQGSEEFRVLFGALGSLHSLLPLVLLFGLLMSKWECSIPLWLTLGVLWKCTRAYEILSFSFLSGYQLSVPKMCCVISGCAAILWRAWRCSRTFRDALGYLGTGCVLFDSGRLYDCMSRSPCNSRLLHGGRRLE